MSIQLSLREARDLALAHQGFGERSRTVDDVLDHLRVLQLDAVNVFARSHYLPAHSRIGDYSPASLDEVLWSSGRFTEYWAHEAACIPVEDRPLFGWRMRERALKQQKSGRADELHRHLQWVRDALQDGGPQLATELEREPRTSRGPWWDWSETKRAVEMLFATGEVVSVGRERFMRRYALTEQVFPHEVAPPSKAEAQRQLIENAAQALGVASLTDLADYYRMSVRDTAGAVTALESAGSLERVSVEGWVDGRGNPLPAWVPAGVTAPPRVAEHALLTPFDPVCWFRPRAERLFDFHYRIEIYTPKHRRVYGYYCLPLMVNGSLVGRLDLKAERREKILSVQAAWQEPDAPEDTSAIAVQLLRNAAQWQGLTDLRWTGIGNLDLGLLE